MSDRNQCGAALLIDGDKPTHPDLQGPPQLLHDLASSWRHRLSSTHRGIRRQDPVVVRIVIGRVSRINLLEKGKRTSFSLTRAKAEGEDDLRRGNRVSINSPTTTHHASVVRRTNRASLTYLIKGNNVNAQTIALIPPITSSSSGAGPSVLHNVVNTYNGLVPISL